MMAIESILTSVFNVDAHLECIETEFLTKPTGNISNLMGLKVKWSNTPENLADNKDDQWPPSKFILKCPQIDGLRQRVEHGGPNLELAQSDKDTSQIFISSMHNNECAAYELLCLERPVPLPKIFGYQNLQICKPKRPQFILMEDLRSRAGTLPDLSTGLSLNQWRNTVDALADLHSWSLTTDVPWRQKVARIETTAQFFKTFFKMSFPTISQSKENFPDYFSHVDESLIAKELEFDSYLQKVLLYQKYIPDVLQHGDTWSGNVMFTKNSDGSLGDKVAAFIDWQLCMSGCGLFDLARLEVWSVKPGMRRQHSQAMLKRYYDRLKPKSRDNFSVDFDTVKMVHENCLALESLITMLMVDIMLNFMDSTSNTHESADKQKKTDAILERIKCAYDDAAFYFRRRNKIEM